MTSSSKRDGRATPDPGEAVFVRKAGVSAVARQLLPWRIWVVMALLGLAVVVVEGIGHLEMTFTQESAQSLIYDDEFIREIVMYAIALPILGGILLTLVNRLGAERDLAEGELDRQRIFAEEVHEIVDWAELKESIVSFPGLVVPAVRSYLTVFDPEEQRSELVAEWSIERGGVANPQSALPYAACQKCIGRNGSDTHTVLLCDQVGDSNPQQGRQRYCLPLASPNELMAVLNFELLDDQQLSLRQQQLLLGYAPQIATAIENVHLQQSMASLSGVAADERRRISRDLHDTLAQNITYLRLKLDQMSSQDGSLQDFVAIQQELERMRVVADEAYLQVRNTLDVLDQENEVEITAALIELAKTMESRTSVQICVFSHGTPTSLPQCSRRRAVYVCREALNNALKHAEANLVQIELVWGAADLTITVTDDGRGFSSENGLYRRGYGMNIMQERAATLGGKLTVNSAPNQGTTVSLSFPVSVSQ